ncbi:YTH domain-containing protein [Cephalotus follicularis]|uniref:YTH domain-containing family protein n=1 Tax=Cephalotus follicularis TaxID=3775 RepID=A0A1Q3BA83_CEPFO|nr:YTH domain-containing protein [Cephalotus follicularis]
MAGVSPPVDQAADLLQKLSLDAQPKTLDISEATKKPSVYQYGSIDPGNAPNGQIPPFERSMTPLLTDFMDPTMCYAPNCYPYFYGGYDGTGNDWDTYSRYLNPDGVDLTSGVYADNGSLLYPHGYGYQPYGPYSPAASPVPTMGSDGQLYGPQQYQYPPYFQPLTPNSGPYTPGPAALPQVELTTSPASDQKPLPLEPANAVASGGGVKGHTGSAPLKSTYQSSFNSNNSYGRGAMTGGISASPYQDPRFGFDVLSSPIPWVDGSIFSDAQQKTSTAISSSISKGNSIPSSRNQNFRPNSQFMALQHPGPISGMGTAHGYGNRLYGYPNKLYDQYGNAVRSGLGYGRGWSAIDGKSKPKGRAFGNEHDGYTEMNRGPRSKGTKNLRGAAPITLAVKGQDLPSIEMTAEDKDKMSVISEREQYNREDFPEDYSDAKFFIIKSYSEDDVHKSIKYNVWTSTVNGNKKLDAAYQEAQQKSGGCPVFLFFSVNTSGQFVGLAEMVGPVDFEKSVNYWQQDNKWLGLFPVKWHIVKDLPNNSLKHLILDYNENKPVTNSRDTQEIKLEDGLKMVKIFKDYSSKTSLLDDFGFYEIRQKALQEKKAKQQQFQKQVWEGKPTDDKKEVANGPQKVLNGIKEPTVATDLSNGDLKPSENGSIAKTGDAPKDAKPAVASEKITANGF